MPEYAFIHPGVSIPLALMCGMWIVWYWRRLGRAEVPESRRRIRRASMLVMAVTLPIMVRGVSFVDEQNPVDFVVAWGMIILLVLLILIVATIDLWNNLRLHRRYLEQTSVESAMRLMKAMRERGETHEETAGSHGDGEARS